MYTIKALLKKGVNILRESNIDNPILDGELILANILGVGRERLIIDRDKILDKDIIDKYLRLIKKRASAMPIQYIVANKEFMALDFQVGEGVLIPRSDTEIVAERAIMLLKGKKAPVIADLCTGSGAIGISLAYYIKDSTLYATDISEKALRYCRKNASKHGVSDRVKILKGDLAKPLFLENLEGEIDVLVSNPPYISKKEMLELPDNISCYEPYLALYGGEEGLDYYRKIIKDAPKLIKKGGILIFEISYNQGNALKEMIERNNCFRGIEIVKDLAGRDRCIYCYLKE